MSTPDERTEEQLREQMRQNAAALRQVALIVEANVGVIMELAKRRGPQFEENERAAFFLVQVIRDLLTDFSLELQEAAQSDTIAGFEVVHLGDSDAPKH